MANLRVVFSNVADTATTYTASSTAGNLAASNMKTEIKSEVWRSVGTSATLTLKWGSSQSVGVVALPFCALTSTATVRVRCYADAAMASLVTDTGAVTACASNFDSFTFGAIPLGVNGFAYGGSTYACLWLSPVSVQAITIDIVDTANPNGYIEAARLVIGPYWTPSTNCQYGAVLTPADMSKHTRDDAGNLRTDRGPQYKTLSFDMQAMSTADRNTLWMLMRGYGMVKPVFMSLVPQADDLIEEQLYMIYGKLTKTSAMKYQFIGQHDASIDIEEI